MQYTVIFTPEAQELCFLFIAISQRQHRQEPPKAISVRSLPIMKACRIFHFAVRAVTMYVLVYALPITRNAE